MVDLFAPSWKGLQEMSLSEKTSHRICRVCSRFFKKNPETLCLYIYVCRLNYYLCLVTSGERNGAGGEVSGELFSFLFKHTHRLLQFSTMAINLWVACVILKHHWDPEPDHL